MNEIFGRHPSGLELSRAAIEGLAPKLERHIAGCSVCADEWKRIRDLDALAVEIPAAKPAADRVEATLAEILARSEMARVPEPRRRFAWWQLAVPTVAASAAAIACVWIVIPDRERSESSRVAAVEPIGPTYRASVRPQPGARFVRESTAPDEVVRLEDGSVRLDVSALTIGDRVRVIVGDTEIDARAGTFDATARAGTLAAVQVVAGSVDIRAVQRPHAVIVAGQRWDANVEPERETFSPAGSDSPPILARPSPSPSHLRVDDPPMSAQPAIIAPPPAKVLPPIAASGMAPLFERGFQQLKTGRAKDALSTFDDALARHPHDPLAEDVAFWRGVALARLARTELAMSALTAFIVRFPQSPRVGEASAMVGWMLVEAGRYDDAELRFRTAASDRATPVRESARRGLAAVSAKRANHSR